MVEQIEAGCACVADEAAQDAPRPLNAATLARWLGVPDAQLNSILPNLKNFSMTAPSGIACPRVIGFMA